MTPRRLKGHKAAATCCVASSSRPSVVASSGEDGCICWFDMRCKDVAFVINACQQPISSLCFKSGNEDIMYVSAGSEISCFDIQMGTQSKPLETFNFNKDEISQITSSPKSGFLASADDSGDVKIVDTSQKCLYKTLRTAHTNICSSVQFVPWKPWTVITGGLDSRLVMWDFSRGRQLFVNDYGEMQEASTVNAGQCFNPPFVHSVAVPEADTLGALHKVCAVARGDGVVDVLDLESKLVSKGTKSGPSQQRSSQLRASRRDNQAIETHPTESSHGKKTIHFDYAMGGHAAAVSCVSFSAFGEKGKLLVSGGNDAFIKLWDWSRHLSSTESISNKDLVLNINITKKVNWLCTSQSDSENLIVCDTSKVLKAYTVQ